MSDHDQILKKIKIAYRQPERIKFLNGIFANFLGHPKPTELQQLEKLVVFIGSERSGSTVCGSLLDAHPDIVISTEFNLVHQMTHGLCKEQLAKLMLYSAQSFKRKGANWTGYSYNIPALHQGTYNNLRIIGDKKANSSALLFAKNTNYIPELESLFNVPLKMVHMIRHPLDVIATISQRSLENFDQVLAFYFKTNWSVQTIINQHPEKVITLRHEDLCAEPIGLLKQLMDFLEIDANEDYYRECAAFIKPPRQSSRERVQWTPEQLDSIRKHIRQHSFLASYDDF